MALHSPNILALGAGGCGIELGIKLVLPEARIVGYVEREAFAAANLAAKIEEGILDEAPIWADVADFDGAAYRGLVDIVSIGLPCQPFSVAGKQEGVKDDRWLWPQVWRILRAVRPRYLFMEEVRGFVQSGFPEVLRDLARDGWSAEWDLFSAAAVGAPHLRQRFFLLGHSSGCRRDGFDWRWPGSFAENRCSKLADASIKPEREPDNETCPKPRQDTRSRSGGRSDTLGNATGLGQRPQSDASDSLQVAHSRGNAVDDPLPRRHGNPQDQVCARRNAPFPPGPRDREVWQEVHPSLEPAVCGMADGMAHRVERLRLCGNGVVPVVAGAALVVLGRRLEGD